MIRVSSITHVSDVKDNKDFIKRFKESTSIMGPVIFHIRVTLSCGTVLEISRAEQIAVYRIYRQLQDLMVKLDGHRLMKL
jgi:hypothetical protein